jgi:Uma2 family endonuclease
MMGSMSTSLAVPFPPHPGFAPPCVDRVLRPSRADALHAYALSRLSTELTATIGTGSGDARWLFLSGPALRLEGERLVTDLAGWRRERTSSSARPSALVPDWVCEVLTTPSSGSQERLTKLPLFARAGLRHVWLVDPERRTLEVLRLEGRRYSLLALHSGEDNVRAEPFAALSLPLRLLWGE